MSRSTEPPFICVTCEAEINGRPTFHVGLAFCCAGCVADGPCICSYDDEPVPSAPLARRRETVMTSVAAPELVGARG